MDSSQWSVTRNRRRQRCPGACGGAGASGKPGFKHLCNKCQMWMCPSCRTAHICFLPGASGTVPDEEPPALPDFGVDSSVLLAHREPPALPEPDEEPPALPDFVVDDSILLAPHGPPTYKAKHETEIQHCDFHGYKLHSEMYICEHHHIKPTSTVLEFQKQKQIRYASQSTSTREACGDHGIASLGKECRDTQQKDASR